MAHRRFAWSIKYGLYFVFTFCGFYRFKINCRGTVCRALIGFVRVINFSLGACFVVQRDYIFFDIRLFSFLL